MISSASTLLTPSEDASWRVWKPRSSAPSEAVDSPADYGESAKSLVVGLPATACRTVALVLRQADSALLQQMVAAQLEKRGVLSLAGERAIFRWHQLGHAGQNVILSVDVLAEPFPQELVAAQAKDYTAALRLCQLPTGQAIITEEQGDLVLAINHQGKLLHSHVFAQRPADARVLANELLLTRLSLETLPGVQPFSGVTLIGEWEADLANDLRHLAGLSVQVVDRLAPNSTTEGKTQAPLLPRSVSAARAAAAQRAKYIRWAFITLAAIVGAAILGWLHLKTLERSAASLASEVEETAAPAAAVKETAERWKAMLPALEPKRYPMVLMAQITSLMPPSGVLIRDFEFKTNEIELKGEARDAITANQFKEDLEKHKDLGLWEWSMPQPQVRENKTVSYRIQAKPKP